MQNIYFWNFKLHIAVVLLHYIVHLPNIEDDISDNTKYLTDEYAYHNEVHLANILYGVGLMPLC